MDVRWVTAFLDTPADADPAEVFWAEVTGSTLSTRRGAAGEFATLLPPDGDAYLRVQRIHSGPAGVHLDLHVEDPFADPGVPTVHLDDYATAVSPGGMTFCLVPHAGEAVRPLPRGAALLDQVCLDVPPRHFDAEVAFWTSLTGWPAHAGSRAEFVPLQRPNGQPLRLLLQRLDDGERTRAHVDFAAQDVAAETARHVVLGAAIDAEHPYWTTLRDPAGRAYCITGRNPYTGVLPPPDARS